MSELIDLQAQLQEKWTILLWSLGIGLIMIKVGWECGYFKILEASPLPLIRGIDVIRGFSLFLFFEMLAVPAFVYLILQLKGFKSFVSLDPILQGWINLLIIAGGFIAVLISYFSLTKIQRVPLFRPTLMRGLRQIGIGIAAWFIFYPLIVALSEVVSIVIGYLFHQSHVEQLVIKMFRQLSGAPWLYRIMGFAIVIIVPITEEFLFRGLLQSWLKTHFNQANAAIVLTSVVFAAFHISPSLGIGNVELLSSLFMFSCVIGYIYEKQRSLWAPIALHGFLNFMSLMMIIHEA